MIIDQGKPISYFATYGTFIAYIAHLLVNPCIFR